MQHRTMPVIAAAGLLQSACLYLDPLQVVDDNQPPEIDNFVPAESDVTIYADRDNLFQVLYSDPDDDPLQLKVVWYLDLTKRAEGYALYVTPQDLGDDGEGILYVNVADPAGNEDWVVWHLHAETGA